MQRFLYSVAEVFSSRTSGTAEENRSEGGHRSRQGGYKNYFIYKSGDNTLSLEAPKQIILPGLTYSFPIITVTFPLFNKNTLSLYRFVQYLENIAINVCFLVLFTSSVFSNRNTRDYIRETDQ